MVVEINLYTEVYRRAGIRSVKVDLKDKTKLSELLFEIPVLYKALKSMERDGIPYIILVDGRYTSLEDDPIVSDGSHIKIFSPVSGGI